MRPAINATAINTNPRVLSPPSWGAFYSPATAARYRVYGRAAKIRRIALRFFRTRHNQSDCAGIIVERVYLQLPEADYQAAACFLCCLGF
jgi:hypothetical protein